MKFASAVFILLSPESLGTRLLLMLHGNIPARVQVGCFVESLFLLLDSRKVQD